MNDTKKLSRFFHIFDVSQPSVTIFGEISPLGQKISSLGII